MCEDAKTDGSTEKAPNPIDIKLDQLSIAETMFLNLFVNDLTDWENASRKDNTDEKFRSRLMAARFNLLDLVNDMAKDLLKEVGVKPANK